jgi:NAD-dependent dihydropyrimidine dehydrogenase PreA subunit
LLEKIETFANLNVELTTKIEKLETNAPSSTTDESLIKKNQKLKSKLDFSLEAYESLLEKMKNLCIHNNELTSKLENIDNTTEAPKIDITEIIKKDASTSCLGLIHINPNPCKQVLVESIIIESCSDKIARENEELRQEVARLGKALYDKKGKAKQTQPTQDNTTVGVNKPVEGETVVCWLYRKEGHKSYQCKAKTRGDKKKSQQARSSTPIPTRWTRRLLPYT